MAEIGIMFYLPFPQGRQFIEYGEIAEWTARAVYPVLPDESEDGELNNRDYSRAFTQIEHEKALAQAEQDGTVMPVNPVTFVVDSFAHGVHGKKRLVPVEQFVSFARSLGIAVLPETEGEPEGIKYGQLMTIEDIGKALAEQHGMPESALIDALRRAAQIIGVRDPRTGLQYTPNQVRSFWDVMAVSDVNKWLEAQGVEYRLDLPGQKGGGAATKDGIKKKALIDKYKRQWPTAETDINEASRNGLNDAALGGGYYDEEKAIKWASARGKFKTAASGSSMADLPTSLVHRSK